MGCEYEKPFGQPGGNFYVYPLFETLNKLSKFCANALVFNKGTRAALL